MFWKKLIDCESAQMLPVFENENTLKSDFGSIWLRNFI